MSHTVDRRSLLRAMAASTLLGSLIEGTGSALADPAMKFGPATPFSFDLLKKNAEKLAAQAYADLPRPAGEIVGKIDYQTWGDIHYNTDHSLFVNGPEPYPVTFFHLGQYFRKSVEMNLVQGENSRSIMYENNLFDMPADSIAHQLTGGVGFAGFRIQEARDGKLDWRKNDWVAFLGAAYFRAIGELYQYGLSARGLTVDVAVAGKPEEFPDFTHFYIKETPGDNAVTVYALLNGPSIVGAYRFILSRSKMVLMDIDAVLFARREISRFGLAPLTSMYWFSETAKATAIDWRPEVHDSDGLALWTGGGERIWRPLNNPQRIMVSSFMDENPRGFGLLQRDRNFDHYLDGVYYDRRPSLWVEPKGNWGKGAVELVEIPTDDEIHDNIVAQWVPERPVKAGDRIELSYQLHWQAQEPYPSNLAICVATRLGNGGQPGLPRPRGVRKFVVEFLGGPLEHLPFGVKPEPTLTASRGSFSQIATEAVPDGVAGHWRAWFDLTVEGNEPVEMRCFLKSGETILTETWAFQYHPF